MHNDYLDPDKHLYHEYDDEDGEEVKLTRKHKRAIRSLREELDRIESILCAVENRNIPTVESLFTGCPEGDFHYDGEPEDVGNAWACGDEDCESGWHQDCQYIDMGRKDGKSWFIVLRDSIAGCGDYQPVGGWDEREGDEITQEVLNDLWFDLEKRSNDHFISWARYNLYCAETGDDPLENVFKQENLTPDFGIKSARENIKILRRDVKRLKKK